MRSPRSTASIRSFSVQVSKQCNSAPTSASEATPPSAPAPSSKAKPPDAASPSRCWARFHKVWYTRLMQKVAFVDRDGTIIWEPERSEGIDPRETFPLASADQVSFMDG